VCCGDFNEVLLADEHFGSTDRSEAQMELFRDCMDACSLVDLGFSGPKFTWSNKQDAQCNVRVRLDRAVANGEFKELFEECGVENIITTSSDHYAVCLTLKINQPRLVNLPVQQGFRYEAAWRRAEDYTQAIEMAWSPDGGGPNALKATWAGLSRLAGSLKDWSRRSFGSVRREIQRLEKCLRHLRSITVDADSLAEEREVER
jgi:hypothetical protein